MMGLPTFHHAAVFGRKTRLPRWKCSRGVQPCCAFRFASAFFRSKPCFADELSTDPGEPLLQT
ncbi:hypothetical protein EGS38_06545 [Neisseria chenwenguii]|nr:hypothetical protein EGS38_06545 [Neisseria chenwenguii]